jgi:hypothetical protein
MTLIQNEITFRKDKEFVNDDDKKCRRVLLNAHFANTYGFGFSTFLSRSQEFYSEVDLAD